MAHESHAVGNELHRGIDLVRHAGGDASHGFELLALRELAHHAARFGHVDHEAAQETHQRSSTTRSSAVTTEHMTSKVPGMHSSSCWRTSGSRERGSSTSRKPA